MPAAEALLAVLPEVAEQWELIIVDDGSRDGTGALVEALARRPHVRAVRHPVRRGYGAAIRSGLSAARHEHVFFTDGDLQFDPAQIRRLIPELDAADVVAGYRHRRADHAGRRLYAWLWNRMLRALLRVPVRDANCAFKLLRRRVVADLRLQAEGAVLSAELLARVVQRGYRVVEVPVDHFPRVQGKSSGGNAGVILRAFVELVRLRRELGGARPS